MTPEFPIYIVSKGRHDSRLTARALDAIGAFYTIIVEEQEYGDYVAAVGADKVLVLDKAYQRDYDACDALGDTKSKGPGPARNFAWDHSVSRGDEWHWVMDDNIKKFYRLNQNRKIPVADATIFRCMEDFVLRYTNVTMAGPNYSFFAKRKQLLPPFVANTRIYSCNLIRNDCGFRWRGRYNEDTDLSLRMLKAGLCTVQFNAFLQEKQRTQTQGGGNTAEFYAKEGTLPKSQMLVALHSDVTELVYKFGRVHHHVDYRPFRTNKLLRRDGALIEQGFDDYGMQVVAAQPKKRAATLSSSGPV